MCKLKLYNLGLHEYIFARLHRLVLCRSCFAGERDNELLNALNILLAIAWHCMHNIRYMAMSDASPASEVLHKGGNP